MKYHIARILKHEVATYLKSTPNIIYIAHQSITETGRKKEERAALSLKLAAGGVARSSRTTNISGRGGNERDSSTSPCTKPSPFFILRTTVGAQTPIKFRGYCWGTTLYKFRG